MKSRSGLAGCVILVVLVVLAVVGVIIWVTACHWSKDGRFVCTPWEGSWWSPLTSAAKPAADQAAVAGKAVEDKVWGDDGLIKQAENWWSNRHKPAEAPSPAEAPAPTTTKPPLIPSSRTPKPPEERAVRRYEAELSQAEDYFTTGMDHYRQANPRSGASVADRVEHLRAAASAFAQADNMLTTAITAYRAEPDHNPTRLADAEALQRYNRSLFETCTKAEAAARGY
jgi:hypothetical protein